MSRPVERRAIDAFSRALRHAPALANDPAAWGGVSVCDWKLPYLDGFELRENDDFIVAYHSEGSRKVRAACNDGPWSQTTSTPGLISIIPPDRRVEYTIEGEVGFASIHLPRRLVSNLAESCFPVEPEFRFAFSDPFASSCIEILLTEARRGGACNFPYVHAMTRALILHVMQGYRASAAESATSDSGLRLDAMLDFIDSRLAEPLKIEELAARAGVSRAHFIRRFGDVTGMTPHRYVTLRRIEKARQMLAQSTHSLTHIALDVGFGNPSHFAQVFHSLTGQTPSQYRRERRAANG